MRVQAGLIHTPQAGVPQAGPLATENRPCLSGRTTHPFLGVLVLVSRLDHTDKYTLRPPPPPGVPAIHTQRLTSSKYINGKPRTRSLSALWFIYSEAKLLCLYTLSQTCYINNYFWIIYNSPKNYNNDTFVWSDHFLPKFIIRVD